MDSISKRIKYLRGKKNLSQKELAKEVGQTQGEISRIESGEKKVFTAELIVKLCYVLNTTYEFLMEGKGPEKMYSEEEIQEIINDEKALRENLSKEELAKLVKDRDARIKEATDRARELLEQLGSK